MSLSFISYLLASIFASLPLAYLDHNGMFQAVSEVSTQTIPSRLLWQQLASFYNLADIVSITLVCDYIEPSLSKYLRRSIYFYGHHELDLGSWLLVFPFNDQWESTNCSRLPPCLYRDYFSSYTFDDISSFDRHKQIYKQVLPSLSLWAVLTLILLFIDVLRVPLISRKYLIYSNALAC